MGNVLRIDIIADGSKAASTFDAVGGKATRLGKALAVGIAGGVATAVYATGKLAVASIKSASAVEQAFGATESVFGKYAATVEKSAKGAASTVGLAQSEYANLANVLGSQLKNMGTSADQLAPKTDALIKQGADLAATFGGTTADAVSAVSSLLKGERDPIERYGVSIKAADVAARLQAQGLGKLTGPAKTAAEAQATLALLTEQTTAAQGAFTRESGTAAGQQQRLTAMWENAKATLGAGLLPIVTQVATFLTTSVAPAVQTLAGQLATNLGPVISTVSTFVTGQLIPALRDTYTWFVTKIAPAIKANVGPILGALGPLISKVAGVVVGQLIPAARGMFGWFVTTIAPAIRSIVVPIIGGLSKAFDTVQGAIVRNGPALSKLGNVLRTVAEFIARQVAPVVGKVLGAAFQAAGRNIGLVVDIIGGVINAISSLVGWVQTAIGWLDRLGGKVAGGAGRILGNLGFGFAAMPAPTTSSSSTAPAGFAALSEPKALTLTGTAPSSSRSLPAMPELRSTTSTVININVDGALDPVAVAEQIRRLLKGQADRTGRPVLA